MGWSAGIHQTTSYSDLYRWAYSTASRVLPTPPMPCRACGTTAVTLRDRPSCNRSSRPERPVNLTLRHGPLPQPPGVRAVLTGRCGDSVTSAPSAARYPAVTSEGFGGTGNRRAWALIMPGPTDTPQGVIAIDFTLGTVHKGLSRWSTKLGPDSSPDRSLP